MRWKSTQVGVRDTDALATRVRASGIQQKDLAAAAGCSKQFISKLVLGKSTRCSVNIARTIERLLRAEKYSLFFPPDFPDRNGALICEDSTPTGEAAA